MREVQLEVNGARRRLKQAYFGQRLREAEGDVSASWKVLREVIGRHGGNSGVVPCGYFRKDGVAVTDKREIAVGLCGFFTKVGPRLMVMVRREREGAFLEYLGDRVDGCGAPPLPGGTATWEEGHICFETFVHRLFRVLITFLKFPKQQSTVYMWYLVCYEGLK